MYFMSALKKKLFYLKEEYPKELLISFNVIILCILFICSCNIIKLPLFHAFEGVGCIIWIDYLYNIDNIKNYNFYNLLASAALNQTHKQSMDDIEAVFSDKWLSKSKKIKILMEPNNLKLLAYPRLKDDRGCVEKRDTLFINLIQRYLSNEQMYSLVSKPFVCLKKKPAKNIFGWLVVYKNLKLMEQFLALPSLDSNQKYNIFIDASSENNRDSLLLMATVSFCLSMQKATTNALIRGGLEAREMITLIVKASATFTPEQKLALLMQVNAKKESPSRYLKEQGKNKLANFLVKTFTFELKDTGAVLYQLAKKRKLPEPLLYHFLSFSVAPHYPVASMEWHKMELYKMGLKKAKELTVHRSY